MATGATALTLPAAVPVSNAGETGDRSLNNLSPDAVRHGDAGGERAVLSMTRGADAVSSFRTRIPRSGANYYVTPTDNNVNLYWPGASVNTYDGTVGDAKVTVTNSNNPYLGSGGAADNRQHPYWRSEQLQKFMNLTTPRTHQYAVWITIGFFEVKRQGDLGMFVYNPVLAFDILGPEIGAANGKNTRYRGFYLIDRLQLTGFNPSSPGGFRQAIVYKQRIQ